MKRFKIISFVVLLMIAAVIIVGRSITVAYEKASLDQVKNSSADTSKNKTHAFNESVNILDINNIIDKNAPKKDPSKYYKSRAYQGAPPTIPHEIDGSNIGGKTCLQCHENGGYVDKFKANAPIVPHPDFTNCVQCHVPVKTNGEFKDSNWEKVRNINIKFSSNQILLTSPPVIPHTVHKNDDCLSCHSGLGIKKIRVTHPERTNCKQCHVPRNTENESEMTFERKPRTMNN